MEQKFNNNASHCKFIGNKNLDEVIASDEKELAEIGGSFDEIANRMQETIDYATEKRYLLAEQELSEALNDLPQHFRNKYGEEFHKNERVWKEYCREWVKRVAKHHKTWYDDKVAIVQILFTRGFQLCPFDGCRTKAWSEDVKIISRKNGRELTINTGTAHLARTHHLLEKDNEYGITPKEFYESFM